MQTSTSQLNTTLERLSSGLRINRAGDDAAGMAISVGLEAQIKGMNQAVRNANDGLSLIGTAEGSMDSYTNMLQRIRELAVQSANDTNSSSNRAAINQEANQLLDEMQRIATTVAFNGTKLFDGTFVNKQLQVGSDPNQTISITAGDLRTNSIGMVAQVTGTAVPASGPLSDGALVINGINIGAGSSDGVSYANPSGSAIAIANAINAKTAEHNVRAEIMDARVTSVANVVGGTFDGTTQQLTINGIDIFDTSTTVAAGDGTGALCDAINAKSNQTGVSATITSGKLVLTAEDGRNITATTTGSIGDELGLLAANGDYTATTGGQIKLISNDEIVVAGTSPAVAGLTATTYAKDPNSAINMISLATVDGANLAITQIDNALEQVNSIRSGLGAITNRLNQTISNLQSVSENLSASKSRICDADFATETATLTRAQILQQAGVSILAQANTTTQSALKLLQS
ncbi:MAG: flagellin [Candidatus Sumerlaeia bacterium]